MAQDPAQQGLQLEPSGEVTGQRGDGVELVLGTLDVAQAADQHVEFRLCF